MLIEGMYLHNQIAVSVFSKKPNYIIFYALGWGELWYVSMLILLIVYKWAHVCYAMQANMETFVSCYSIM